MKDYRIAKQITLDKDIQLFLLPVVDNLQFINRNIIPKAQQKELDNYKFRYDVDKRLLARSFCYEYVQQCCHVNHFELGVTRQNKPFFKTSPHIDFSFSYAKEYVFVGISNVGKKIGVDIEYINSTLSIHEIAPEIMCPAELDDFFLHKHKSDSQQFYFFSLFSAKESIIKAFGTGLYFDVRQLNTLSTNTYMHQDARFRHQSLGVWKGEYTLSVSYEI